MYPSAAAALGYLRWRYAGVLPTYVRAAARQVDADLEIDGSEGSKFRQIKALARSFQQLSSATATTYP
jgi:hypothetical protein